MATFNGVLPPTRVPSCASCVSDPYFKSSEREGSCGMSVRFASVKPLHGRVVFYRTEACPRFTYSPLKTSSALSVRVCSLLWRNAPELSHTSDWGPQKVTGQIFSEAVILCIFQTFPHLVEVGASHDQLRKTGRKFVSKPLAIQSCAIFFSL